MNQERFDIEYEGNRILENTRIDGNLKTDKSVYLDGMIQGNVHAGKLVIINKDFKDLHPTASHFDTLTMLVAGVIFIWICNRKYHFWGKICLWKKIQKESNEM